METEDFRRQGLELKVDDLILKMAIHDQTKILQVKQLLATIDHTPDHPVYCAMIEEAITELDEEGGSTKEAISQFIMKNYDVLPVVHDAKLIEQLVKLVEGEELVFTSENRYMLPAENEAEYTSSPSKSERGEKQLVQCEQDWRSNKLHRVDEVEGEEDQRALMVTEDQLESHEMNEPTSIQSEGFENQIHLEEEQVRISEEDSLKTNSEGLSRGNEGWLSVIERKCGESTNGVDERRHAGELQIDKRETWKIEKRIQLQQQKLQEIGDQVEVVRKLTEEMHNVEHPEHEEIKGETQPQVPEGMHVEEHCQLEQIHSKNTDPEIEVMEEQKELHGQDNEAATSSDSSEHFTEQLDQDEAMIAVPSSSHTSEKLVHVGSSLSLLPLKEKCKNLWQNLKEREHQLLEVISCLSSMEGEQQNFLDPTTSAVLALPASEPLPLYVPIDAKQRGLNQQLVLPKLKRTSEVEINALEESLEKQKKKAKPRNHEWTPRKELATTVDIITDTGQVKPERQLSQEMLQHSVLSGDAKKFEDELVEEQKTEVSVEERSVAVKMTTVAKQCQIKRKMVVDKSSQLMKPKKKVVRKKKTQMELPRRQPRHRGRKASKSDPGKLTDANDLDLSVSSIKLGGKQKPDPPIDKRPQKQKPNKVQKLSELVEQEVKHHAKKRHLRSQLALITSDEIPVLEYPAQYEPAAAEDFVQTQQQQQRLQPLMQCSSQAKQAVDRTIEESPSVQHQNGRQIQLVYRRRRELKSEVDAAKEKLSPVDCQNHHEQQPSQIQEQRHKHKTNTEPTMRDLSSDHQTHDEKQPSKHQGRPPILRSAANRTTILALPAQRQY